MKISNDFTYPSVSGNIKDSIEGASQKLGLGLIFEELERVPKVGMTQYYTKGDTAFIADSDFVLSGVINEKLPLAQIATSFKKIVVINQFWQSARVIEN